MKLSKVMRWLGPAAISYALFLVVSDMSGMPVPLLDTGIVPAGSSVMGSGLILWAIVLLLVGMLGLYARLTEGDADRKADEREARYRRLELEDDETFEQEFGWDVPEAREAEELLVSR